MPWARMSFRGDAVWVNVGDDGKMVLDPDGRAGMKYRPDDPRVYRPAAQNLLPLGADADKPAATLRPRRTVRKPRAASKPAAESAAPAPAASHGAIDDVLHVWTDGACTGNPGPMGIGVVVIGSGRRREHGEYLGHGTNNIAELVAIERGLELAAEMSGEAKASLRVYTDSAYSIGVLSLGWKAKANQDLVARLRRRLATTPRVAFVKVAGHAGVPENERCDELARGAVTGRGR